MRLSENKLGSLSAVTAWHDKYNKSQLIINSRQIDDLKVP